ncbi:MAG: hypothetical protein GY938_13095 [Ketobacter sp.]|nr:hypothetical protein [Ketobacter sp.]
MTSEHCRRVENNMPYPNSQKLKGDDLVPGSTVVINWGEHQVSDQGYLLLLPAAAVQDAMFIESEEELVMATALVHVPNPTREPKGGSDGPKWMTLADLLAYEHVVEVIVDSSSIRAAVETVNP